MGKRKGEGEEKGRTRRAAKTQARATRSHETMPPREGRGLGGSGSCNPSSLIPRTNAAGSVRNGATSASLRVRAPPPPLPISAITTCKNWNGTANLSASLKMLSNWCFACAEEVLDRELDSVIGDGLPFLLVSGLPPQRLYSGSKFAGLELVQAPEFPALLGRVTDVVVNAWQRITCVSSSATWLGLLVHLRAFPAPPCRPSSVRIRKDSLPRLDPAFLGLSHSANASLITRLRSATADVLEPGGPPGLLLLGARKAR